MRGSVRFNRDHVPINGYHPGANLGSRPAKKHPLRAKRHLLRAKRYRFAANVPYSAELGAPLTRELGSSHTERDPRRVTGEYVGVTRGQRDTNLGGVRENLPHVRATSSRVAYGVSACVESHFRSRECDRCGCYADVNRNHGDWFGVNLSQIDFTATNAPVTAPSIGVDAPLVAGTGAETRRETTAILSNLPPTKIEGVAARFEALAAAAAVTESLSGLIYGWNSSQTLSRRARSCPQRECDGPS